nr:transglutaminase domain-containing protein [bacterium]
MMKKSAPSIPLKDRLIETALAGLWAALVVTLLMDMGGVPFYPWVAVGFGLALAVFISFLDYVFAKRAPVIMLALLAVIAVVLALFPPSRAWLVTGYRAAVHSILYYANVDMGIMELLGIFGYELLLPLVPLGLWLLQSNRCGWLIVPSLIMIIFTLMGGTIINRWHIALMAGFVVFFLIRSAENHYYKHATRRKRKTKKKGTVNEETVEDINASFLRQTSTQVYTSAVIISAIVLVLCDLFYPIRGNVRPVEPVRRIFQSVETLANDLSGWETTSRDRFSMADAGYMPLGDRLGGPISPSSRVLFYVEATSPTLLRAAVKNQYTGKLWQSTMQPRSFRFIPYFASQRRRAFSLNLPKNPSSLEGQVMFTKQIKVIFLASGTSCLPAPERIMNIKIDNIPEKWSPQYEVLPYFNDDGEVFLRENAPKDFAVSYTARTLELGSEEAIAAVRSLIQDYESNPTNWQLMQQYYLDLPDTLPESVQALAQSLTADVSNPLDKALALKDYLTSYNFIYTLLPVIPPEDEDFVAYFLRTGEGYCTYFASAFAVMARSVGLPTRYVEGYAMPQEVNEDGLYVIRQNSTHAWTEVYFEGVGWVAFDTTPMGNIIPATPESGYTPGGSDRPERPEESDEPDITERPIRNTATPSATPEPSSAGRRRSVIPYLLLAAGLLMALRIAWARLRLNPKVVDYFYKGSLSGEIRHYQKEIMRLLRIIGVEPAPGETLNQFARRVDTWLREPEDTMAWAVSIPVLMQFAEYEPTRQDVDRMHAFVLSMEDEVRSSAGKWAKFTACYLHINFTSNR